MKILDRYLATNIISATLVVLLTLIGLAIFISLVREIRDIGTGSYGVLSSLEYVLFDLPQEVYNFFPVAALLGVLLGLGVLANHSELIVMRASGVSLAHISWAVIKAAIFLLIFATIIGEWLGPLAEHSAESRKELLTSSGQALKTGGGTWIRDGQNFLYIHTVYNSKHLEGVSRYEFDQQRNLITASYAKTGDYENGAWLMHDVVSSHITPTHVTSEKIPAISWHLTVNPSLLRISAVDPDEMSLLQLHAYIRYLNGNNLNSSSYALAFWQRILQPLATLVMVWLAIPFIFGSLRSMSIGLRIIIGSTVGFCFYILNQFFGPFSIVYQWPPFLAALLPTLLFALAAFLLQRRVR